MEGTGLWCGSSFSPFQDPDSSQNLPARLETTAGARSAGRRNAAPAPDADQVTRTRRPAWPSDAPAMFRTVKVARDLGTGTQDAARESGACSSDTLRCGPKGLLE